MALQEKIIGVHMVVEAVDAERGSSLNAPVPISDPIAVYLDYREYWIRTDQTAVKVLAELNVVPNTSTPEGLHKFHARFMLLFMLSTTTDQPEVEAFLRDLPSVDRCAIPTISQFAEKLSSEMWMQPIKLFPRPPESPLIRYARDP